MSKNGVIYILTNPSFPQYVKIGYATDVKQRLDELNRSTAVPFAFRVYATYEVDSALSDKKIHSILDKLNPELRSAEEVDGKRRVRREGGRIRPQERLRILPRRDSEGREIRVRTEWMGRQGEVRRRREPRNEVHKPRRRGGRFV